MNARLGFQVTAILLFLASAILFVAGWRWNYTPTENQRFDHLSQEFSQRSQAHEDQLRVYQLSPTPEGWRAMEELALANQLTTAEMRAIVNRGTARRKMFWNTAAGCAATGLGCLAVSALLTALRPRETRTVPLPTSPC
jgi:hypothetical protein